MTGPEHYQEAERFAASAEEWMDDAAGWKTGMSAQERIARRATDLQAAQVHATLAQTDMGREYVTALNAFLANPAQAPEAEASE
jgi:hypothetical protein